MIVVLTATKQLVGSLRVTGSSKSSSGEAWDSIENDAPRTSLSGILTTTTVSRIHLWMQLRYHGRMFGTWIVGLARPHEGSRPHVGFV